MQITRTSQELLTIYNRLRATAETLDQSELDTDRREDYVTITFKQVPPEEGQWELHGTREINSFPSTVSESTTDGLISRKTEITKFNISESQWAHTEEFGHVRHNLLFEDDGRSLKATDLMVSYSKDYFLATQEQVYLINPKSGKMKTLAPKIQPPPL